MNVHKFITDLKFGFSPANTPKFHLDFRYLETINAFIRSIIKTGIAVLKKKGGRVCIYIYIYRIYLFIYLFWGGREGYYNGNIIIPDVICIYFNLNFYQRLIKWNLAISHPRGPEKKIGRLWSLPYQGDFS